MKNGIVIWNVLLTLLGGYLLFAQLSNKGGSAPSRKMVSDSMSRQDFRIAYFEMDSIEAHFDMVKDVKSEIEGKEKEYSNGLSQLDLTYRKKVQEYQQKSATMTQADYEKAQMDLKQLEDLLKGRKQDMDQQYQEFVTRRNLSLKKKIEEFIADYNKGREYSYIVANDPGVFYYKDTIYDITSDVIKGLNERYKKEKP